MVSPSFNQIIVGFGYPLAAQSKVRFPPFKITVEFGGVAINLGGDNKLELPTGRKTNK